MIEEEEVEEDAGDSSLERLRELAGVKISAGCGGLGGGRRVCDMPRLRSVSVSIGYSGAECHTAILFFFLLFLDP